MELKKEIYSYIVKSFTLITCKTNYIGVVGYILWQLLSKFEKKNALFLSVLVKSFIFYNTQMYKPKTEMVLKI